MLLFDFDGTLMDSSDIWYQIDLDFTAKRNLPYTEEYHNFVAHSTAPASAKFTKEYYHLDESEEEILKEWSDQAFYQYTHGAQPKSHAAEYLEQCKLQGKRMAVVTSAVPELCKATLKINHLDQYFERYFFAEEIGFEKKNPELFHIISKELKVSETDCTLYDDSPVACKGAKSAGLQVIGVYDNLFAGAESEMRVLCDGYIHSFSELLISK